ncbi:DUF3152 domain-containing protein [Plantactinospora sp. KBS50]|uniref:DUF3152 domain-containing protein n=1 Tax=Plantactinospora sp. KBS50 TaxID=2024580 RepID=UPI000BAB06C0|nr:DUF3152 domain-containing protein [Plantactinospora sp. KBS50]ASW53497.1 hypothetical protein CIK06_03830 [Plantactinospora sp. KBS50]
MWRRRRRTVLLLLALAAALVGVDRAVAAVLSGSPAGDPPPAAAPEGADRPDGAAGIAVTPVPAASDPGQRPGGPVENAPEEAEPPAPPTGPGTFAYAPTGGELLGAAGTLHTFHVAVEQQVGQHPEDFAEAVDGILGDPRSWIAGGDVRFQRVPGAVQADFTIYLATAATSELMCAEGGLSTEKFTSCRLPGRVIINLSRWLGAVPGYGAPLAVYQAYAVNHEVGHELGLGHEACPGPGAPAPVMQQQTYGLVGCVANAWPYLDGRRYAGSPVSWG